MKIKRILTIAMCLLMIGTTLPITSAMISHEKTASSNSSPFYFMMVFGRIRNPHIEEQQGWGLKYLSFYAVSVNYIIIIPSTHEYIIRTIRHQNDSVPYPIDHGFYTFRHLLWIEMSLF